jgi:hypothetical protein
VIAYILVKKTRQRIFLNLHKIIPNCTLVWLNNFLEEGINGFYVERKLFLLE